MFTKKDKFVQAKCKYRNSLIKHVTGNFIKTKGIPGFKA